MKPGKTGVSRWLDATCYSWRGLRATFRHEAAFRQELLLGALLLAASFWLATTLLEWLLLVLPLFIMLIAELLNSAIECLTDRIGEDFNELSARAKDSGSAAVFVSLLLIAVIWLPLMWSRFHA